MYIYLVSVICAVGSTSLYIETSISFFDQQYILYNVRSNLYTIYREARASPRQIIRFGWRRERAKKGVNSAFFIGPKVRKNYLVAWIESCNFDVNCNRCVILLYEFMYLLLLLFFFW